MFLRLFTPLALVVATLPKSTVAYPTGAGACTEGNTVVQGAHLTTTAKTGSLADGGFSVSLGESALMPGAISTFDIDTNTALTITGRGTFRGFLMRLGETGGVSTVDAFSVTSSDVQLANACFDVGGVTHTSNQAKTSASATLNLASAANDMPLDVTIVVENSGGVSEYYYSQFTLTAVAAGTGAVSPTSPDLAPASSPTDAGELPKPTPGPETFSPVVATTSAPVGTPRATPSPIIAPPSFGAVSPTSPDLAPASSPTDAGELPKPTPGPETFSPMANPAPFEGAPTQSPVESAATFAPIENGGGASPTIDSPTSTGTDNGPPTDNGSSGNKKGKGGKTSSGGGDKKEGKGGKRGKKGRKSRSSRVSATIMATMTTLPPSLSSSSLSRAGFPLLANPAPLVEAQTSTRKRSNSDFMLGTSSSNGPKKETKKKKGMMMGSPPPKKSGMMSRTEKQQGSSVGAGKKNNKKEDAGITKRSAIMPPNDGPSTSSPNTSRSGGTRGGNKKQQMTTSETGGRGSDKKKMMMMGKMVVVKNNTKEDAVLSADSFWSRL